MHTLPLLGQLGLYWSAIMRNAELIAIVYSRSNATADSINAAAGDDEIGGSIDVNSVEQLLFTSVIHVLTIRLWVLDTSAKLSSVRSKWTAAWCAKYGTFVPPRTFPSRHPGNRRPVDITFPYLTLAFIHRVKWRHKIYGHDTIAILWV